MRHDRVCANLGRQPGYIPGAGPSTRLSPLNARETPDIAEMRALRLDAYMRGNA